MAGKKLYFLLNRANRALTKRVDALAVERVGATSAQLGALFFVAGKPGCRPRDLARMFGQRDSAIATLVTRLEAAGLLDRRASETDGRAYSLHITSEGHKTLRRARPLLARLNAALTEGFSDQEIETIVRFLTAVRTRSEEELL